MNILELITFLHVIGVALGFGGAMISDAMFFSSVKDKKFTVQELRFMKLGGKLVWVGIAVLITSGIGLVYLNPALLTSAKFLLKMIIVGVIIINGIFFHLYHIPNIEKHKNKSTRTSPYFQNKGYLLTISGGISVVSWLSAALLGSLSQLNVAFSYMLGVYVLLLCIASISGVLLKKVLFN